jgi:hypothetical protein
MLRNSFMERMRREIQRTSPVWSVCFNAILDRHKLKNRFHFKTIQKIEKQLS